MAAKVKSKAKKAAPAEAAKPVFSLISNETLLALYASMVRNRTLARAVRAIAVRGPAARRGSIIGHEAAIAGAILDLKPRDTIIFARADAVTRYLQGAPLAAALAPPPIGEAQSAAAHAGPSSGSFLRAALDAATTAAKKKSGNVVVAFCDAGSSELPGALASAGAQRLPILFVRFHRASTASRRKRLQHGEDLSAKAKESGIPSIHVDGADVVAVYRVAHEAVVRARIGRGPTLIECMPHVAAAPPRAGKPKRVRAGSTTARDSFNPIVRMEHYLGGKGLSSPAMRRKIAAGFRSELDAAIASLKK